MGIFDIFRRKGAITRAVETTERIDEYRERAARAGATRLRNSRIREIYDRIEEINAEIELKKAQEVLSSYEEDEEDDVDFEGLTSDPADTLINTLLANAFSRPAGNTSATPPQRVTAAPRSNRTVTDDQIKELLSQVPKDKMKLVKGMNDGQIHELIGRYYPDSTEDDRQSAIALIRAG